MQFELEPHHRDLTSEQLLEELRRVAALLKRNTVTIDQFNEHAKFHSTTLARRFGLDLPRFHGQFELLH